MSKPSDFGPGREKQPGRGLAAMTTAALVSVAAMLLQTPLCATAGVASGAGDRMAPRDPPRLPAAPSQKAPETYQLRCWQHGRLLFDEGPVTLGPDARQGARLVAIDRNGAPLIVTIAGETTCQTRPFVPVPDLTLPH